MKGGPWKLSPSDFAFLWEECKRCFYLKVRKGIAQPRAPMPGIFSTIDSRMKAALRSQATREILPELPAGRFGFSDRVVHSRSIVPPGRSLGCYVYGRLDTVIQCENGEYAVIDFKTTDKSDEQVALYSRQLHAYTFALENATPGKLSLTPVTRMGLLTFAPSIFSVATGAVAMLSGEVKWIEIPREDQKFLAFLGEVMDVLSSPAPPPAAPECAWCQYREMSRATSL